MVRRGVRPPHVLTTRVQSADPRESYPGDPYTPILPPSLPRATFCRMTLQIPSSETRLRQDNFPLILLLLKLVESFLAKPLWPEFLLEPAELL